MCHAHYGTYLHKQFRSSSNGSAVPLDWASLACRYMLLIISFDASLSTLMTSHRLAVRARYRIHGLVLSPTCYVILRSLLTGVRQHSHYQGVPCQRLYHPMHIAVNNCTYHFTEIKERCTSTITNKCFSSNIMSVESRSD